MKSNAFALLFKQQEHSQLTLIENELLLDICNLVHCAHCTHKPNEALHSSPYVIQTELKHSHGIQALPLFPGYAVPTYNMLHTVSPHL